MKNGVSETPQRATIQLFGDRVAIVDAADYERVNAHRWYAKQDGAVVRAYRHKPSCGGRFWTVEHLECFILGTAAPQATVGFVDGNPLHCWRDNLKPKG